MLCCVLLYHYRHHEQPTGEDKAEPEAAPAPAKKEKEPTSFVLSNPCRIIPVQTKFVSVVSAEEQRYAPVGQRTRCPSGIVMLVDLDPSVPEEVHKGKATTVIMMMMNTMMMIVSF